MTEKFDYDALALHVAIRESLDEPDESLDRLLAEAFPSRYRYIDGDGLIVVGYKPLAE